MAFTHKTDFQADHSHDTVAQARACEQEYHEDLECQAMAHGDWLIERRYERWLEEGGAHRESIAAEDEIERERERHDPFLVALRAGR